MTGNLPHYDLWVCAILTKIGISAVSKTSRSVLAQQQSGAARLRNKLLEEFERIEGLRSIERVKAIDHSFSTSHVDEARVGFQPTPKTARLLDLFRENDSVNSSQ